VTPWWGSGAKPLIAEGKTEDAPTITVGGFSFLFVLHSAREAALAAVS
jgi:hypothetical protein